MKKAIILVGLLIPAFSTVSFYAYSQVWASYQHEVMWESNLSTYRCSPVSGSAILSYGFSDDGSHDKLNSAAVNDTCFAKNGSEQYVQAWSKDGNGQVARGDHVRHGKTSYANQVAAHGPDYAYMKVYKK